MPHYKFLFLFSVALILNSCKTRQVIIDTTTEETTEPKEIEKALISIGDSELKGSDLKSIFSSYIVTDSTDFKETLEDLISQKRIFLAAKEAGYTKNNESKEELLSYKKVLALSFIQDSTVLNKLLKLTYKRLGTEVNASHILTPIPFYADPKDTLRVYSQMIDLRNEVIQGANFDSLAKIYSADKNTKDNGGQMGWFSALQLLYPLESAAYSTKKGEVSMPVRTMSGYHIIKVNDIRKYSGQVEVSHILKAVPENSNEAFSDFQKAKTDSLYALIQGGESFKSLCQANSDDTYSSSIGGLLAPFSIGSRQERNFEETAFNLKIGAVSKPVRTEVGWHLIQLNKIIPLEPYETLKEKLKHKVTTDSRGAYLEKESLNRYLNKLNFAKQEIAYNEVINLANEDLKNKTWHVERSKIEKKTLLEIDGIRFSNYDFLDYAEDKQSFEHYSEKFTPKMYLRWFYDDFEKTKIKEAVVNNLEHWNSDFKHLLDNYEESLAISQYLTDELYDKSIADTTGQRIFYENNRINYQTLKKVQATIIKANTEELVDSYYEMAFKGAPYRLKRGIRPIYFEKNQHSVSDVDKRKLTALILFLEKNPTFMVEVGGHRDVNEEPYISSARIQNIVAYLQSQGLDITRIQEYDYGQTALTNELDWSLNQRASFQFFGQSKTDLVNVLNNETDKISISSGEFADGESELIDGINWEVGEFETNFEGEYYRIEINKIIPARNKSINEARGAVIADYQSELKKQLMAKIAVKYPVEFSEKEIKSLFEEYLKNNQ